MDAFRMMLDQAPESIIIPEPSRRLVASLFGVTMVEWVERGGQCGCAPRRRSG